MSSEIQTPTKQFNSGKVQSFNFTFEEIEGKTTSIYLTFLHCKDFPKGSPQRVAFESLETVLNSFAKKYGIQTPEETIANNRATNDQEKPRKLTSTAEMLVEIYNFQRRFSVLLRQKEDEDLLIQIHEIVSKQFKNFN